MTVRAKHNLIYNGTFYKAGETIDMPANEAADYTARGWLVKGAKVAQDNSVATALPALNEQPRKKK